MKILPTNPPSPDDALTAQGVEARVCRDIARRQALGIIKYGTTVEGNKLTRLQWFIHHYEELLDAAIYARKNIEEMLASQEGAV